MGSSMQHVQQTISVEVITQGTISAYTFYAPVTRSLILRPVFKEMPMYYYEKKQCTYKENQLCIIEAHQMATCNKCVRWKPTKGREKGRVYGICTVAGRETTKSHRFEYTKSLLALLEKCGTQEQMPMCYTFKNLRKNAVFAPEPDAIIPCNYFIVFIIKPNCILVIFIVMIFFQRYSHSQFLKQQE